MRKWKVRTLTYRIYSTLINEDRVCTRLRAGEVDGLGAKTLQVDVQIVHTFVIFWLSEPLRQLCHVSDALALLGDLYAVSICYNRLNALHLLIDAGRDLSAMSHIGPIDDIDEHRCLWYFPLLHR